MVLNYPEKKKMDMDQFFETKNAILLTIGLGRDFLIRSLWTRPGFYK
jgi:hypothetical protein